MGTGHLMATLANYSRLSQRELILGWGAGGTLFSGDAVNQNLSNLNESRHHLAACRHAGGTGVGGGLTPGGAKELPGPGGGVVAVCHAGDQSLTELGRCLRAKPHEVCGRRGRSLTIRTRNPPQDNPPLSGNEIEGVSCDYDFCICACCVGPGNHPKSSGRPVWDGHEGLFVPRVALSASQELEGLKHSQWPPEDTPCAGRRDDNGG